MAKLNEKLKGLNGKMNGLDSTLAANKKLTDASNTVINAGEGTELSFGLMIWKKL